MAQLGAQLGFLGLGIMGQRMAGHLLKAGHEVALWSHTAGKAERLAKEGQGTACATPRAVAERSDFVFLCVGDTAMVRRVTLEKDGLIEAIRLSSESSECFAAAIQWHPEFHNPEDPTLLDSEPLLENFLDAVRKRKET